MVKCEIGGLEAKEWRLLKTQHSCTWVTLYRVSDSWGLTIAQHIDNVTMPNTQKQRMMSSKSHFTLEGKHGIGCRIWFSVEEGRRKESAAAWWRCCENLVGATPLCATTATSAVASNRHWVQQQQLPVLTPLFYPSTLHQVTFGGSWGRLGAWDGAGRRAQGGQVRYFLSEVKFFIPLPCGFWVGDFTTGCPKKCPIASLLW